MTGLVSAVKPSHGFHPTSTTYITLTTPQASSNCTLHLYFTLPPLIFIDPYELAHHAQLYTFKHWGTTNLELPVHAVPQNNSMLLINLKTSLNDDLPCGEIDVGIRVDVPLHLRYGDPRSASDSGYHTADMDWPTGFLVCSKPGPVVCESHSRILSISLTIHPKAQDQAVPVLPPEVLSFLGVQSSFAPVLITIPHANHSDIDDRRFKLRVPVGNPNDLWFVEPGMVIMILMSFLYLVWISSRTAQRIRARFGSVHNPRLKTE
jgi:hypothetical protein